MDGTLLAATDSAVAPVGTSRGLSGTCLVFGVIGNSSAGKTRFLAGSLALPKDLSRVKLLLDHDATDPLGYLTEADLSAEKFTGSFTVAGGPRGDLALAQASDKRRDGLSVGCSIDDWAFDGDVVVIKAATLTEVSLVSIPAFSDARITEVRAARKDETIVDRKLLVTCSDPSAETPEAGPAPVAEAQPEPVRAIQAASPVYTAPRKNSMTLAGLVAQTQKSLRSGPAAQLTAALADVTPVSLGTQAAGEGPNAPAYVGELWEAADVARPFLDAVGVGRLTSMKMFGFRWNVRPTVAKYSGNKAEIPTNAPSRERAEWSAQRFAGGWDVDRVFIALPGGTDFLRDIFVEATMDYKTKSEAYAVERLLAEGTVVSTESTVPLPTLLATIGQDVAAIRGGRIDVVQMGTARWSGLLGITDANLPWWIKGNGGVNLGNVSGTLGGINFAVNHDLDANTVVVLDKRAVKAQEVDPPIRVQALDVPHGGVDLGVFGYIAVGVTDSRLVRIYKDTTP